MVDGPKFRMFVATHSDVREVLIVKSYQGPIKSLGLGTGSSQRNHYETRGIYAVFFHDNNIIDLWSFLEMGKKTRVLIHTFF